MFSRRNGETFVFEDSDNNKISIARSALKQSTRAPRAENMSDPKMYFITLSDADESQNFNTGNNNATAQYYQDDVITVGGSRAKAKARKTTAKARKTTAKARKTRARK